MSLTLEDEDLRRVDSFWTENTPERQALEVIVDSRSLGSDAAVLRALVRVGAEAVRERLLDEGYAALAVSTSDAERAEQQTTRAVRRRAAAARDARD